MTQAYKPSAYQPDAYFIITSSADGLYFDVFANADELTQSLEEEDRYNAHKHPHNFLDKWPGNPHDWEGKVIIKGKIVVPQAVKVATKYQIE